MQQCDLHSTCTTVTITEGNVVSGYDAATGSFNGASMVSECQLWSTNQCTCTEGGATYEIYMSKRAGPQCYCGMPCDDDVQVTGDPHATNMQGEKFDILS